MRNPESDVIDTIDALVDEQLSHGPVDDYSVNRYPKCPSCHCDWHGTQCAFCRCPSSDGEVLVSSTAENPVIYPRWHITEGEYILPRPERRDINHRVVIDDGPPIPMSDFTLGAREGAPWVLPDDPLDLSAWGIIPGGQEPQWLQNVVQATNAYTLEQLWALRDEMWRQRLGSYHYVEYFAPPEPVEPVYLGTQITNVRFYGVVSDVDSPQPIQATLELVAPNEAVLSLSTVIGDDTPPQFTFNEDAATLEITASGDGYVPVGTIAEDAFEIHSDCTDLAVWGGNEPIPTTDDPLRRAQRTITAIADCAETLARGDLW